MSIKIELGPGSKGKSGFIGLDIVPAQGINPEHVLNFETDKLPFEDNSIEEVFSSHCWEHIESPHNMLNELMRVCKDGAKLELWMPYGHSNDAFVLGHEIFYTELVWRHFTIDFPQDWIQEPGQFLWDRVRYNLKDHQTEQELNRLGISMDFALKHMVNIAWEFGIFLTVNKQDKRSMEPKIEWGYGR